MEELQLARQAKLLQYANQKRNAGDFNDIIIEAGGERIPANRMVLACYSKFFESMFLSPMKERYQNTVEIKDFDGKAVKHVIEFLYSGFIEVNAANVLILLGIADFLQVDDVKKMCFDFMETSLTVESCLDIVKVSVLYNYSSLQLTYQYVYAYFDEIVHQNNFKDLSIDELKSLFAYIDRNTVDEASLYKAVINWVGRDLNRLSEFATSFFTSGFNTSTLSLENMAREFAKEWLAKTNVICLDDAVLPYFTSSYTQTEEKSDEKALSQICVLGGVEKRLVLDVYSFYDEPLNIYPDLPYVLSNHGAVKLDDTIYCIGGVVDGDYRRGITNRVQHLNLMSEPPNSEWEEVACMGDKRSDFGAVAWKGLLVVAGGYTGLKKLRSTEAYDPGFDKWKRIAPMNVKRDEHALVVADERLFAIGGCDEENETLSFVEQLDSLNGSWAEAQSMNVPRSFLAVAAYGNFIFAFGGKTEFETLKTVERYDINEDQWSFVSCMYEERCKHKVCVLEGYIFVVGGKDARGDALNTIERYDPFEDEWSLVGETEQDFFHHSLVAL